MKTIVRQVWTATVFAFAVICSGCATSTHTARSYRSEPLYDFSVVRSSSDRKLSTAEMDLLQMGVEKFLAGQGLVHSGEYLVRIDFPPLAPDLAPDWVLVKLVSLPVPTFTLVDTYAAASPGDYYYADDLDYGYAPYGYNDPFGFYYPWDFHRTSPVRPRHDGDHGPGGHHPGDKSDPPGQYAGGGGRDHHWDGPGHPGEGPSGRNHRTRTADYSPYAPPYGRGRENAPTPPAHSASAGGGRQGGGSSITPPQPRQERAAPPTPPTPSPSRQDTTNSSARDNRYK